MIPNAPATSQSVEQADSPMCVDVTLIVTALVIITLAVEMSVHSSATMTLTVLLMVYVILTTILTTWSVISVMLVLVNLDAWIASTAQLIMSVQQTFV